MKVLHGYRGIKNKLKDPILAIGIFDGIHLGHKKVLKKILSQKDAGRDRVVMTFDPHPRLYLNPVNRSLRIMSLEHRMFIFEKMGIDDVIVINFSDYISAMAPEDFVKKVIMGVGARTVYVGSNFYFGKGKSGDVGTFKELGKKYGIEVHVVQPVKHGRKIVSSTWLRKLITTGNIEKASKLLRRPPSILGTVVTGDRRGSGLGVPTANIDPHHEVIPPPGVYSVKVDIDGSLFNGVINIGFNPTFYGAKLKKRKEPQIEVHILDFKGDLYDRAIEIFFIKRLRKEKRFKDEAQFKKQISRDIAKANEIAVPRRISHNIIRHKSGREFKPDML